jgi:hypothetical protein
MHLKRLCGLVAGGLILAQPASAQEFDRTGWFADLEQMREAMSLGYANMEWAASERQSLKTAWDTAYAAVGASTDDASARTALTRFASSFADGHVSVRWPAAAAQSGGAGPASPCAGLAPGGASDRQGAFPGMPGYEPVPGDDSAILAAGLVTVDGKRFGVLRIPAFGQFAFPEICNGIAAARSIGTDCDEACLEDLEKAAHAEFVAIATRQLRALAAGEPDALIIDLARNGGGDDSSEAIARMVTRRPLRSARIGMMRTPAWTAKLDSDIEELTAMRPSLAAADRATVDGLIAQMTAARDETRTPCDRSPMWRDEPVSCSQLVETGLSATGWINGHDADQVRGKPWEALTFSLASYPYEAGIWDGPLYVVVDQGSASSAEQFASVLRDNDAAVIIGAPSFGAGCGHWLGGEPVRLNNSGGEVSMPDCVRYRADGANEVGGIVPDVLIPLRNNDTRQQRATRMRAALASLTITRP